MTVLPYCYHELAYVQEKSIGVFGIIGSRASLGDQGYRPGIYSCWHVSTIWSAGNFGSQQHLLSSQRCSN